MLVTAVGCVAVVAGLGLAAWSLRVSKAARTRLDDEEAVYGYGEHKRLTQLAGLKPLAFAAPAYLGLVLVLSQCFYAQDAGDVVVLRDLGGTIAGSTSEEGFHGKLPWQDCVRYDIRNNVISFVKDGTEDYVGGSANGPQVTVNDASGVSANMDVQVNYSLDPSKAVDIYRDYGTQENFVKSIAAVDARSVPREVAGRFDTITLLTDRGKLTQAVEDELAERWERYGLVIEQVSVQEIRYPDSVKEKYNEANQALIEKEKAENRQETAKVEAETKKIEAEGEAEANRILSESLTDEVVMQRYIEALEKIGENGNLVVVPEGSKPIVGSSK